MSADDPTQPNLCRVCGEHVMAGARHVHLKRRPNPLRDCGEHAAVTPADERAQRNRDLARALAWVDDQATGPDDQAPAATLRALINNALALED